MSAEALFRAFERIDRESSTRLADAVLAGPGGRQTVRRAQRGDHRISRVIGALADPGWRRELAREALDARLAVGKSLQAAEIANLGFLLFHLAAEPEDRERAVRALNRVSRSAWTQARGPLSIVLHNLAQVFGPDALPRVPEHALRTLRYQAFHHVGPTTGRSLDLVIRDRLQLVGGLRVLGLVRSFQRGGGKFALPKGALPRLAMVCDVEAIVSPFFLSRLALA